MFEELLRKIPENGGQMEEILFRNYTGTFTYIFSR